ESTASLGVVIPGPQQDSGVLGTLHRAPGVAGTLATGLASRSQYAWVGVGYTRFAVASNDRRPDTLSWSAVYGYRPPRLRRGYEQVNLTVFGMDCAPCAHAIHVSMKGIQGVNTVDVDLNTGLVSIKLTPGNNAAMRQFNEAVEKNGFTHKDANVVVRGQLSGS